MVLDAENDAVLSAFRREGRSENKRSMRTATTAFENIAREEVEALRSRMTALGRRRKSRTIDRSKMRCRGQPAGRTHHGWRKVPGREDPSGFSDGSTSHDRLATPSIDAWCLISTAARRPTTLGSTGLKRWTMKAVRKERRCLLLSPGEKTAVAGFTFTTSRIGCWKVTA